MPRAKRRFGQHFLSDPRILARIADALGAEPHDTVLEIGPGPGGLTAALVERAGKVIAIEKDRDLVPALRERFPDATIVEGDALEIDWKALGADLIAGNIPYNITSPLVDKALEPPVPRRIVFLVQREVADRLAAQPSTNAYGALTVGVRTAAMVERLFVVPAGAFHPRPKIDSAVVRLTPLADPLVPDAARAGFRRMVTGVFGFRRKQLVRGVRELTGWPAERVETVLAAAGLPAHARPETLAPGDFVRLHAELRRAGLVDGAPGGD